MYLYFLVKQIWLVTKINKIKVLPYYKYNYHPWSKGVFAENDENAKVCDFGIFKSNLKKIATNKISEFNFRHSIIFYEQNKKKLERWYFLFFFKIILKKSYSWKNAKICNFSCFLSFFNQIYKLLHATKFLKLILDIPLYVINKI